MTDAVVTILVPKKKVPKKDQKGTTIFQKRAQKGTTTFQKRAQKRTTGAENPNTQIPKYTDQQNQNQ